MFEAVSWYNQGMAEEYGMLEEGEILRKRYMIAGVLGQGAYGVVYLVDDITAHSTQWALKEVREGSLESGERTEAVERFEREARILRALNHTGIPKVIDSFSMGPCHYIVMEHIEGKTLAALSKETPLDEEAAVSIALKICNILEYLHCQDPKPIIFRDLKPDNIMVTPRGRVILVDFGIARFFNPQKEKDTALLGTPGFSAPEQYGTAQSSPRSDIYALGATVYHLLTGEDLAHFAFKIPPVRSINKNVSPALENILCQCLELDPAKRPQSMEELRNALRSLNEPPDALTVSSSPASPSPAVPVTPYSPSMKNVKKVIGVIFIMYVLSRLFASFNPQSPPPDFFSAVVKGDVQEVRQILASNASLVNTKDKNGNLPLHCAVHRNNLEMTKLLLQHRANVNATITGQGIFPLYIASYYGYKDIVEALISSGADINKETADGDTALMGASDQGREEVAALLITRGADISAENKGGSDALCMAIRNRHWDIADLLISKGAEVDKANRNGAPPIVVASVMNNPEGVSYLLSHGARIDARESRKKSTALMQATWCGHIDVVKLLLEKGADPQAQDHRGATALHVAGWKDWGKIADVLIEKGAKVNQKAHDGWTPLHSASSCGSLEVIKVLIARKAEVNARDNAGETPLAVAEGGGKKEAADYLRKAGGKK
ncbi:MAG: ankyrin repeat domain-containing protein [Candidatus Eremiobacteraeota bacterium]|nr:ankyrin repeat domain-containing protein [Candidatus Eremiobacteraeota bacterium]